MTHFKKIKIATIIFLILASTAFAQQDEFAEAKALIQSNSSCTQLSDAQLIQLGDYYMEQMHPGASHTAMEQMMGGEDSLQTKNAHLLLAKQIYCKDPTAINANMMGNTHMNGMMNNGYWNSGMFIITILLIILLTLAIIWFIRQLLKK